MKTERELFEARFGEPEHWIEFDEVNNKYTCKYNAIDHHLLMHQARWEAWQASAKREGFVLAPVEPTLKMVRASEHIKSSKTIRQDIYKAMVEAANENQDQEF